MEKQLTLQSILDNINNSYNTLFDSIGSINNNNNNNNDNDNIDDLFKFNKFHLYGENNIDEIYNSIDQQLQTIKFTCQQYRSWDQEKETSKFLNTQKLYHQTQQRVDLISKTLFDCLLNGKVYLNQQQQQQQQQLSSSSSNNIIEIKRKLGLLVGKLQEMSNELNQKYSTFCVLEDLLNLFKNDSANEFSVDSVYSCNISSSTFLLDIFIYGNGEIKEVKLVHISLLSGEDIPAEQEFNDQLTKSLQTDMKKFIEHIKRICELDLLFRKYKSFDLQKAFTIFQSDFKQISKLSNEKYTDKDQLFKFGFGEIEMDNCGVKIKYFNPYIEQISKTNHNNDNNNNNNNNNNDSNTGYSLMIEMESGLAISSSSNDKSQYSKLSLKSQLVDSLNSNNFNELLNCFNNSIDDLSLDNENIICSPVRFVCKLNEPLLITKNHLLKILNLSKITQINDLQQINNILNNQQDNNNNNNNNNSNNSNNYYFDNIENFNEFDYYQDNDDNYSIQSQLSNNNTKSNKNCDIELFNKVQRYYYTGSFNLGLKITRIPITHPIQIYPIIQLLRQQHTFNILFKSCFVQPKSNNKNNNDNDDNDKNNQELPIFEITSNPPNSINIIFLNPIQMDFNSINIIIKNNGDIESQYFDDTSNSTPNISKSQLFTKLLLKSTSIPISLFVFLNFKNK